MTEKDEQPTTETESKPVAQPVTTDASQAKDSVEAESSRRVPYAEERKNSGGSPGVSVGLDVPTTGKHADTSDDRSAEQDEEK